MSVIKTDHIMITPKPLEEALGIVTGIVQGYKGLPIAEIAMVAVVSEGREDKEVEFFSKISMQDLIDISIEWDVE